MRLSRHVSGLLAGCVLLGMSAAVAADAYPSQVVRIIVPFAAGGGTDTIARLIAERLGARWGSPVIVENRTGAGGSIGTDAVAKAPPDGHTLLMTVNSHAINASLYDNLPYHPTDDFRAVIIAATSPNVLAVNPDLPVESVQELIELARSKPGELAFGSGGVGVPSHLAGELFKSMADIDMIHVPYRGIGPAITGTLGGEVQLTFAAASGVVQYMEVGRLRGLAVTSPERSALMPELPTMIESGLEGFDVVAWFGLLAPAGTPDEVITQLNREIAEILNEADVSDRIALLGAEIHGGPAADFEQYIEDEWRFWDALIRERGITVE